MAAELAVTGWFLSPIIREMQDTALAYIRGQFSWKKDQEKDLERLDTTLTEILTIVDVIEKREIKDGNQRRLLSKLKDAIYSAVDVLDSFQYMVLESKVDSQSVVSCVTSSCIYLGKRSMGTDSFRRKLADILEKLAEVKTTADTLLKVVSFDNATAKLLPVTRLRVTSPLKENHHIYGRRDELDKLRNMLFGISDGSAPGPSNAPVVPSDSSITNVISIVGVGGVGKTSLAQLAFRDEQIRMNFGLRMWVSVSDTNDEIRLARDILESLTDENYHTVTEFDKLQNALHEKINGKKFLLILDDVWYDEDRTTWENKLLWSKVLSCLNTGLEGSKILATTRADKTCSILDARTPPLRLGGLDGDDYWLLFRNCAFGEKYPGQFPELKEIGVHICCRLNGLPLAAKIIGRLLNADLDVCHWKKVLESDLSDDVMKVLRLSYQHLPVQLKICFSFCSLFPKDWRFDPGRLTEMWIAQGFVQREDPYDTDSNIEDVAKGYFDELVQRSFFERSPFGHQNYVMHDLINDLARNVSKDEYVRVENDKQQKEIPPNIRHLSISANLFGSMKKTELGNLRTLIVWKKTSPCLKLSLPDDVFNKSKSIRVLDLSGCCLDRLPRSVQVLKRLRYFAFRVPEKPWKIPLIRLYHLEVLVTNGHSCRESECVILPAAKMKTNLLKLRKAFLYNVYGATISGFGGQTRLHGVGEFHVKKESGYRLGELKEMKHIVRHLKIRSLENVERQQEAVNACLDCKEHIEYLELEWSIHAKALICEFDYDVLSALRPHPDLDQLKIIGYRGARSPNWFETNWLTAWSSLALENCIGWVQLPPFGQLPLLKYLQLRGMHAVKQIGQEFYGNGCFPVLEDMVFDGMLNWEGWSRTKDGSSLLPCLERLHISRCPKLREIPSSFSAKPRVEVEISSDSSPTSCLIDSLIATASRLIFVACSYSFLSDLNTEQLNHVAELNMKNCTDPMPAGGFHRLGSLEVFRISNCSTLLSSVSTATVEDQLETYLLPPSLCHIEISQSNVHCNLLPRYLQGLTCLSTLVLDSCHLMTSLSFASGPHHLTALETITIRGCNELASLDGFRNHSALRKLVVADCYNFCSLPTDLNIVGSLEELVICGCPMMRFLPEDGLPTSVQTILLSRCHPELESQLQRKEGAEWNKILHIPKKKFEIELIDLLTLFPANSS
ncbi:hypothetical protein ACQ4PT_015937 [Festuca glaucescens]